MEQSPSWEADRFSAILDIPHILWNTNVHYRIHNSPQTCLFLNQIIPVHAPPTHFFKIHFCIIFPYLRNADTCTHILLNHQFINTLCASTCFKT